MHRGLGYAVRDAIKVQVNRAGKVVTAEDGLLVDASMVATFIDMKNERMGLSLPECRKLRAKLQFHSAFLPERQIKPISSDLQLN